jgi:hypothetical protein
MAGTAPRLSGASFSPCGRRCRQADEGAEPAAMTLMPQLTPHPVLRTTLSRKGRGDGAAPVTGVIRPPHRKGGGEGVAPVISPLLPLREKVPAGG